MKVRIKTEHGRLVARLPVDKPVSSEGLAAVAADLDQIGQAANAGTIRLTYRDRSNNKIVATLTWLPDDIEEPWTEQTR